MISRSFQFLICVFALSVTACEKHIDGLAANRHLYSDTVLYLKSGTSDQVIYPLQKKRGKYFSFPDGLALDENTGAINVSKSETGLRYLVFFDGEDGCSISTPVVISGINYPDHYYNLASGDSIAKPTYNAAQVGNSIKGSFYVNDGSFNNGISLSGNSGTINLAATVRTGFFGESPVSNTKKDVPITYRIDDPSNNALNNITVRLYYFNSIKEVPEYLTQLLAEREPAFEPLMMANRSFFNKKIKPRPPCIIIIAH